MKNKIKKKVGERIKEKVFYISFQKNKVLLFETKRKNGEMLTFSFINQY